MSLKMVISLGCTPKPYRNPVDNIHPRPRLLGQRLAEGEVLNV